MSKADRVYGPSVYSLRYKPVIVRKKRDCPASESGLGSGPEKGRTERPGVSPVKVADGV